MSTIRPTISSNDKKSNSTVRPDLNSNGESGGATVRPNGINGTVRPKIQSNQDFSSTIRPDSDKTTKPQGSHGTTSINDKVDPTLYQPRASYTINGITYNVIKALSLTSGEAQVFLVADPSGKKHVLKLYYKGARPNVEVLNKVVSVNNANILYFEESHGDFEDRYFELMKYYDGKNLENIDVRKNEKVIIRYIGKMASAIDFCHQLGFIHRDIKPSNFLFENNENDKILLGDFGIAVKCDANGKCISDMARTKIYAAPEVYLNTGDGKANFSIKSDFYSLGITILFLWMGKADFTHFEKENELQLATLKAYGNLPIPSTMPPHLYSLVKALIEPNPNDRAGFKEIEDWLKGGNPFGNAYNQQAANNSNASTFKVVFNGQQGLIASSPKELARIMMSNQKLAISYLYKGKVSQWLEDNGRPELAVEMERIKEDIYPNSTTAGLEAACYILNPSIPFNDVCGNNCTTSSEISNSILTNFELYQRQIAADSNCRLLVYLQTHGLEQVVADFKKEFANNSRLGLLYLAYRLDPTQPWRMTDEDGAETSLNSCDEILHWVSKNNASEESLSDIVSRAFLLWTGSRDAIAAASIKPIIRHQGDLSYSFGVLYRLNPKVGLFFVLDEKSSNYVLTIKQLGELINKALMNVLNNNDSTGISDDLISEVFNIYDNKSHLYNFLQSKGKAYEKYIDWIKYCLDIKSEDNTKKAGPNSDTIGMFKLIKGMAGNAYYVFKSGKKISNPSELTCVSKSDLQDAINNQIKPLDAWIAVFYQEDPALDKSTKYAFERKTAEYVDFLSTHGLDNPETKRYKDSKTIVESRAKKLRDTLNAIKKSKIIVAVISLIPLGIATLLLAFFWRPDFNSLKFDSVFKPVAIILTIYFCIIDGFVGKVIGEAIWGCVIGAIVSGVIVWLSGYAAALTPYLTAGLVAAIGIYFYKKCLAPKLKEQENSNLLNPGFEHLELEPLHEAYHPNPNGFDSSIGDMTSDYQKELSGITKAMWTKAIPVGIITLIGILYFMIFGQASSSMPNDSYTDTEYTVEQTAPDFSGGLYGTWVGKISKENAQLTFEETGDPGAFTFTLSDSGSSSAANLAFSGTFNSTTNELNVNKCRVSSDITMRIKSKGTLSLNKDRIIGELELSNPKDGTTALIIPIDVQYVPE